MKDLPPEIVEEGVDDILERTAAIMKAVEEKGKTSGSEVRSGSVKKSQFTYRDVTYADFLVNDEGALRVSFHYPIDESSEVYRTIIRITLPELKQKGAQYRVETDEQNNITAIFADALEPYMLLDLRDKIEKAISSDVKGSRTKTESRGA